MATTTKRGREAEAKPRSDAYTGILIISLIALIAAAALMYLDYSSYEGKPPAVPSLSANVGGGATVGGNPAGPGAGGPVGNPGVGQP